jgi:hypothetical protein
MISRETMLSRKYKETVVRYSCGGPGILIPSQENAFLCVSLVK